MTGNIEHAIGVDTLDSDMTIGPDFLKQPGTMIAT